MKKLLLLLVAACFIFGANAQKSIKAVKTQENKLLGSEYQSAVTPVARTFPPAPINYSPEAKDDPVKIYVGKAHSQRGFRREDCTVISYIKELDLISISFILDEETYPDIALSNGSVAISYSADHGQTWSVPVLLSDLSDPDLKRNYYLSGVIYNPVGNTVIEDAYGVYQGVAPDDDPPGTLGDWNNQAFGTSTLGGANYYTEYFTNTEPDHAHDGYFNQFGLTQKEDIMKCFNIWAEGGWAAFTHLKLEDIQGTFNGTGFDWDLEHSVIDMPLTLESNGQVQWPGKWTHCDASSGMVWSDDGMIGYAWLVGGSADNLQSGYQPLLYKTTDNGDSWYNIELDFQRTEWQDFFRNGATIPEEWLIFPCQDLNEDWLDFCIPYFRASVGAVDAEGNLQLFGELTSHGSDFISGNNFTYEEGIGGRWPYAMHLFKFTIGDELIDIMHVDSLKTIGARDQTAGAGDSLYCVDVGWLHRMNLTKDERSEEFFLTWNDTPEGDSWDDWNYMPDIYGWSYNITNGVHTDPVCFTDGFTFPFEHYWFISASEYAYYNSDDETFTIPMVSAIGLAEFYNNTVASADAIDFHYVTGITFDAIVPISVGIDEFSGSSNISVSQNLPNPATGNTTIKISSETVASVTVEVSNICGQTVHTTDAGIINRNMSVNIDVSNLEAGVYLYTVTIANERVSKKMIVK